MLRYLSAKPDMKVIIDNPVDNAAKGPKSWPTPTNTPVRIEPVVVGPFSMGPRFDSESGPVRLQSTFEIFVDTTRPIADAALYVITLA